MPKQVRKMWCVVKKAYVKEKANPNSKTIGEIHFYKQVIVLNKRPVNGMIRVEVYGKQVYRGWVSVKALTPHFIRNTAGLFYQNSTGKLLPVAKSYLGKRFGYIKPGETVKVFATVDDWCMTDHMWTKTEWLTKCRDIYDRTAMETLLYSVVYQAGRDFQRCVNRLKSGKIRCDLDFMVTMERLIEVSEWLLSEEYQTVYSLPIRVNDLLGTLMEQNGVDKAWFRDQVKRYDELMAKRNIYHPRHVTVKRRDEL